MKTRARGYTAVEVMIAMTLLAVGAAGVVSMQRGAILGNVEARRLDTANAIAHMWLDRLQSDAMMWTTPNKYITTDCRAAGSCAKLLGTVDDAASAKWRAPTAYESLTPTMSRAADVLGHDLPLTAWQADPSPGYFCTNVRLTWLVKDKLVRAEVRVFWTRGLGTTSTSFKNDCADEAPTSLDANTATQQYHFVYAMTAIRQNEFYER